MVSSTPPASICAAELIAFASGSGSLRESADAMDQLSEPTSRATAPDVATGCSPNPSAWLTSTSTPAMPARNAIDKRGGQLLRAEEEISDSDMKTGMVGQHDGGDARRHALLGPEEQAVIERKIRDGQQVAETTGAGWTGVPFISIQR